jgi:hypothetical protein
VVDSCRTNKTNLAIILHLALVARWDGVLNRTLPLAIVHFRFAFLSTVPDDHEPQIIASFPAGLITKLQRVQVLFLGCEYKTGSL